MIYQHTKIYETHYNSFMNSLKFIKSTKKSPPHHCDSCVVAEELLHFLRSGHEGDHNGKIRPQAPNPAKQNIA